MPHTVACRDDPGQQILLRMRHEKQLLLMAAENGPFRPLRTALIVRGTETRVGNISIPTCVTTSYWDFGGQPQITTI